MTSEIWRCVGSTDYEASTMGRIRRSPLAARQPGRVMTPQLRKAGYLTVSITVDGKVECHNLHRLVCIAFKGEPPTPEHQACHRNGDRMLNRPGNLRWGTPAQNAADKISHGTHQVGGKHPRASITSERAAALRAEYAVHVSERPGLRRPVAPGWMRDAAVRAGLPYHSLRKILKGRGYPEAGGAAPSGVHQ